MAREETEGERESATGDYAWCLGWNSPMLGVFRSGEERRLVRLPIEEGAGGGAAGGEDLKVRGRRGEERSLGRIGSGGETGEGAASAASAARGEGGEDC